MKSFAPFLIALLILPAACENRRREELFKQREAELNAREQQLIYREKTVELKEQQLVEKANRLDSTLRKDSVMQVDPLLVGSWSVNMTCTETTCNGSAVGDIKNEQWDISYQGGYVLVRAKAGNNLVRVYSGTLSEKALELAENTEGQTQASTKTTVRLQIKDANNMEGQREIVRDNNCRIVYALQMTKEKP